MDGRFWSWLIWGGVVFIAFRVLVRLALELQTHLQELLVAYVREQKELAARNRKIMEIRDKVRRLKDAAKKQVDLQEQAKNDAVREQADKVRARVAADQAERDAQMQTEQRRAA
ncbi:hypothetical protein SH449x_004670 [Pirellulaceae bacterium SH449]